MTIAYDSLVAGQIQTAGYATLGTNLWLGPVSEDRLGQHVFVVATGGVAPEPIFRGNSKDGVYRPSVQVLVQSAKGAFESGQTLARNIFNTLSMTPPSGLLDQIPDQSQPLYIGCTKDGSHQWTINLTGLLVE